MWKLILGFVLFAGLALFLLSQGGDVDMSGEKHGVEVNDKAAPGTTTASK